MHELNRFQNLRKKIVEVMNGLLAKELQPTNRMVRNLVQIQDSYINTYHPDFMGGVNSIVNVFDMAAYNKDNPLMQRMGKNNDSFDDMLSSQKNAFTMPKQKYGAEMLVQKKTKNGEEIKTDAMTDTLANGRLKFTNESEI
jgi:dynamin 1-like protein